MAIGTHFLKVAVTSAFLGPDLLAVAIAEGEIVGSPGDFVVLVDCPSGAGALWLHIHMCHIPED